MGRSTEAYLAIKAYVEAGLVVLARRCDPQSREVFKHEEWLRTDPRYVERRFKRVISWDSCIRENLEILHDLPEYTKLLDAVRQDSIIGPQLNVLVGSPLASRTIKESDLSDDLINEVAKRTGSLRFDEVLS